MDIEKSRILIFKNKFKKDKQPDYRAELNIDNVIYEADLWIAKDGTSLTGTLKPKHIPDVPAKEVKQETSGDLPF